MASTLHPIILTAAEGSEKNLLQNAILPFLAHIFI